MSMTMIGSTPTPSRSGDGRAEVFKEKIEFDEEKKIVIIIGLEGDVFKICKVLIVTWKLTPKGQGSLAKETLE
ncbi:hypothetical protein GH714_017464 [Hevea brasiliensis]|uniref:Bet v I/Major latex protein domain-containing protein n=1 Tax=Hevea brasiliensis TaxID=3981 RepID=A0A6A6LAN9_HEVBR|nr:hypothetical protein GH714_017464 [Hevea brasiliensis]